MSTLLKEGHLHSVYERKMYDSAEQQSPVFAQNISWQEIQELSSIFKNSSKTQLVFDAQWPPG
jgi:hypothetical protein